MQLRSDPVKHLFTALTNAGLIVEEEEGANHLVFLKVKELTSKLFGSSPAPLNFIITLWKQILSLEWTS